MKIRFFKALFIAATLLLYGTYGYGQIIDLNNENPYRKVFIETDNFGVSYLDILETNYKKIDIDSIKFSVLNDLAYYWHTRDLIKALDLSKQGIDLALIKKDTLWEGRFQITHGAILLRMEKLDDAYIVLENAKSKVMEEDLAFLNTQLGYVFERKGQLDRAADYALESLRLGEKFNDKRAIAIAYSDLSNLFWKHSKFEKGLEYGLKSLQIFEERGMNDLDYDFTLYVVGNNYLALKKYQEALNFYKHSIAIGERYGFYNNLSDVYISLVDLYAYLNQFKKSETAIKNALKYATLLNNNFMLMRSWLSIGKLQILQGKYITAIESLNKSIEIATDDFGDNYYLSIAYESLGKAYAGNHNYKDAYSALAAHEKLKNKIFTAESDQRISLLQTEFDVAQKESTIQVQETQLKKQKTRQILISVVAGLLFLLLLLLYITFRNNRKKNRLLQNQNKEKEFLLKEIHHRVKNNLGIVSSLLSLQSAAIDDPKVKYVMEKSQNRIYSMSMIHQKLYQGKNLTTVEMKDYFMNLSMHILDSFGKEKRVTMVYNMKKIDLEVDTAIPLGLIVNELLTNSLKYAFPNNKKGKIKIAFHKLDDNIFTLKVADNGVGIQENQLNKESGFGTQLINLLVQQLEGKMSRKHKNGVSFSLQFKTE